jgi:hypothetical protein
MTHSSSAVLGSARERKAPMKRVLVVFLVAGLAVALYASTAGGSQQAVTPAQFAALKKQVGTLQKQVKVLNQVVQVLAVCDFDSSVPITNSPALHVTSPGENPDAYLVGTNKACADAMNTPSGLHKLMH